MREQSSDAREVSHVPGYVGIVSPLRETTRLYVGVMTAISTPEASAFFSTIATAHPHQLTACGSWRVHELVAHLAAGAAEITRNLEAFAAGGPDAVPPTRSFDEREQPYRAMDFELLHRSLLDEHDRLIDALSMVLDQDPNAVTPWTGRQMPVRAFVTHMRSEYALHRWDIAGDDETSTQLLSDEVLTDHAVLALGAALVARGTRQGANAHILLTSPGRRPVAATAQGLRYGDEDSSADQVIVVAAADPAARLLFLWGRTPNQPGRLRTDSPTGTDPRQLLAGY